MSYKITGRRCCVARQRRSFHINFMVEDTGSIWSTIWFITTSLTCVYMVHIVNHSVACCISLLLTTLISLKLLTIAAGVGVGDSAKSPCVGYVRQRWPFWSSWSSLCRPAKGQMSAYRADGRVFARHEEAEIVNSKAWRMDGLFETSPTRREKVISVSTAESSLFLNVMWSM